MRAKMSCGSSRCFSGLFALSTVESVHPVHLAKKSDASHLPHSRFAHVLVCTFVVCTVLVCTFVVCTFIVRAFRICAFLVPTTRSSRTLKLDDASLMPTTFDIPLRSLDQAGPSLIRLGISGFFLCCLLACSDGEVELPELKLTLVSVEPVTIEDLENRVTAVGELVAPQHAEISAEVDGRVTEIHLVEGGAVLAGQALLELDPAKRRLELAAARARVSEAVARVDNARRQVRRQRELKAQSISSQSTLDGVETALRLAEAQLAAARADLGVDSRALEEATVRAPFDGIVVERLVSLGEYVQIGKSLVEIVSLNPIEVSFRVAEVDSSFVRTGQQVDVHVAPYPDRSFAAAVTMISPTIDPQTRTLRVKAALDNSEGLLRPGLFARADLGLSVHEGVAVIASSAVLQRVDGSVVFVLAAGDHVERRVVQLGNFQEGRVEVTDGLREGDRALVRGHADLVDGQQVRVYTETADVKAPAANGENIAP
jgi:membrane fusion protein (multidrug efflux system)